MEDSGSGYRNLAMFRGVNKIRTNISTIDEEDEEIQGHKPTETDLDFDDDNFLSFGKTKGSATHNNIYKDRGLHINRNDKLFMDRNLFSGHIQPRRQNYIPVRHNKQRLHHSVERSGSTEEITRMFIALSNTREDRVADMLVVDTKQNDKPYKPLQLSEADKDRFVKQKHEFLIEGKGCCDELVESISDLKVKIQNPETNNTQSVREFDCKEKILSDSELKYRIIVKDDQCGEDSVLKQENGGHGYMAQAQTMQQEINSLRNQLENKELEVKRMQAKYNELQKSHTTTVKTNSVRMKELQSEIYENQRSNANASYENLKLKKEIDHMVHLKNSKFNNLPDSDRLKNNESFENFTKNRPSIVLPESDRMKNDESFEYFKKNRSSLDTLVDSTPTNYINDEINQLKQEAERTKNALQASGVEIKSLEGQLRLKIIENKHLIFVSICLSVLGFLVSVGTLLWS